MGLRLMASLVWDLEKFQFPVFLLTQDWFGTPSLCALMRMILEEYFLGIRDQPLNSLPLSWPLMGNSMSGLCTLISLVISSQLCLLFQFSYLLRIVIWFSITYIIGVETCCIGSSSLKQTSFKAIVDSGSSFTFLPKEVYKTISAEVLFFPFQIELWCDFIINLLNVTVFCDSSTDKWMTQSLVLKVIHGNIATSPGKEAWPSHFFPPLSLCVFLPMPPFILFLFCFIWLTSSQRLPKLPSVKLMFPQNNSFVVNNPVFVIYGTQVGVP